MSPAQLLPLAIATNPRADAWDLARAVLAQLEFEDIEALAVGALADPEDYPECCYDLALDELVTAVCSYRATAEVGMLH